MLEVPVESKAEAVRIFRTSRSFFTSSILGAANHDAMKQDIKVTNMIAVSSENQLEDLKAANDVLLVYFAPPTCNVGESLLDKVVAVLADRPVAAAQVDTSANPAIAGQHLVLAFPTIIVFIFGREFERLSRIISIGDLERALDRAVTIVSDANDT